MSATGRGSIRHGHNRRGMRSPEYQAWAGMRQRCHNKSCREYRYYGARGISVHPKWKDDFAAFLADVGARPSSGHSIDRIDNNGDYAPGNVRWATRSDQMRNTRRNVVITLLGRTGTLKQWSEWMKIPYKRLWQRIYRDGKTPEAAMGLA